MQLPFISGIRQASLAPSQGRDLVAGTSYNLAMRFLSLIASLASLVLTTPAVAEALPASSISPIPDAVWAEMQGKSFNPAVKGCAGRDELRLLVLPYRDYEGKTQQGRMIVHRDVAEVVQSVFLQLYADNSFAIAKMELIDAFGGDDDASMAANNTSGYNCRAAAGSARLSSHARGIAIDVNPRTNPFVRKGTTSPPAGEDLDTPEEREAHASAPGLISATSAITKAFAAKGWTWGGTWKSSKDYQHFSADGH